MYTMSVIIRRLKETKHLSASEQVIAQYILDHPECILKSSAKELANQCYTSSPTIIRFVRKLGFMGYPEFRYQYIEEYNSIPKMNEEITLASSLNDVLALLPKRYEMIAKNSADRINTKEFSFIVSEFRKSNTIDFYATGINMGIAQAACVRFNNLGYHAQVQLGINKHYIYQQSDQQKEKTLSFIISHTGTNESVIEVAHFLKNQNMKMVHLGRANNTLYNLADYHILWDNDRYDSRYDNLSYPISLMFILDTLYLELSNIKKYNDPSPEDLL